MLTPEMKSLISNHRAGMVASINEDGTPAVSPKATFVILDDCTLAFGNIRSPGTVANVLARPRVEICFIDVVLRKAVRVAGTASVHDKATAPDDLAQAFTAEWKDFLPQMSGFVRIDLERAELILSPAYDGGATEDELRGVNMAKLEGLYGGA